jgi:hypothetical protein
MKDSDSIQFDPPKNDGPPGYRWLKLICVFLPAIILGMTTTKVFHRYESQFDTLHTTDAIRGLVIDGMRIHRLDSSSEKLSVISDLPTSYGFPIIESRLIETPWIAGYIWSALIESGTQDKDKRTEGKDFFPDWAIEIDNGERVRTVLVSTKDNIMIFIDDSRWYYHGLDKSPASTLNAAIQGNYESMPDWKPEPTPIPDNSGKIRLEYRSKGFGSPSWPDLKKDEE